MRKILSELLITSLWTCASYVAVNEIVYNLGTDPRTIDGVNIDLNIFEGLLQTGLDNMHEPACTESWEVSDDGLTWTFHLRENLKWSDGQPLTAARFNAIDFVLKSHHRYDGR